MPEVGLHSGTEHIGRFCLAAHWARGRVLPRELWKERSPAAIFAVCRDTKGSLGTVSP